MALTHPTPAPQLPHYVLEERQNIGSIIGSIISGVGSSGGGSSGGGDSGNSGGGSSDGGGTSGGSGGSTGDTGSGGTSDGSTGGTSGVTSGVTSDVTSPTTSPQTSAATTPATSAEQSPTSANVVVVTSRMSNGGTTVFQTPASSTPDPSLTADSSSSSSSSSNGGLIGGVVGGVVGGLALITALIFLVIVWRRRRSRTGHGWFLCFGTRPKRGSKDLDVDWPTFDPTSGAAGVGGTLGSRSGRGGRRYGPNGGTLPDVDDAELHGDEYSNDDEMRELGSGAHQPYSNSYYTSGPTSQNGYSSGHHTHAGPASYNGPSDEGHYRSGGWAAMQMGAAPAAGNAGAVGASSADGGDSAPTYDHLDPPEVRQARAREQAEAQAQAMAAYGQPPSSPPQSYQTAAPAYYNPTSSSPPPAAQRPLSDHRLSSGTTQALASHQYFDDPAAGTVQSDQQQRMLHLHNPDA